MLFLNAPGFRTFPIILNPDSILLCKLSVLKNHSSLVMKKIIVIALLVVATTKISAQECDCNKEFLYMKDFIEHNYAGFNDKLKTMTKPAYDKMTNDFIAYSKDSLLGKKCLLLISEYLQKFRDDHIQVSVNFDGTKLDSALMAKGEKISITDKQMEQLGKVKEGYQGIYYFKSDSTYKIAVLKNKNALRDYVGVMVSSKLEHWKKGQVKFEAKQVNDSLLRGVLYLRNHLPKVEWFWLGKNTIGGDWLREGISEQEPSNNNYVPVASIKLSDKTLYIKISSFSPNNGKNIDSIIKANKDNLESMDNLVLDLRDNGGGSDYTYGPLMPYVASGTVKGIGVDALSTAINIKGWKKILEDNDIPDITKASINQRIKLMEGKYGKLVNIVDDDSDVYKPTPFPKKVAILINRGCASTTEQFLLFARQSSKVILMGQSTQGTLDYANMREANFICMPYILEYATTRSRRLDIGQGIDNVGIKPKVYFTKDADWIKEATKILEKK